MITEADIILIRETIGPVVNEALRAFSNAAKNPNANDIMMLSAAINVLNTPNFKIRLPMRELITGIQAAVQANNARNIGKINIYPQASSILCQANNLAFHAIIQQRARELENGRLNITMEKVNLVKVYGPWSLPTQDPVECAICLETKAGYNVKTNCNHSFCGLCTREVIKKATNRIISCPMCRSNVRSINCENMITAGTLFQALDNINL